MSNSNKMAETVARLDERDEKFDVLEAAEDVDTEGNRVYPLSALARLLEHDHLSEQFGRIVSDAKMTTRKSGRKISDHFVSGCLFDAEGEIYVTVYAAFLILINAGPESDLVAHAQDYFASKANESLMEDEKRLRGRYEVIQENKNLQSTAQRSGVKNFQLFNAAGYQGLYGGRNIGEVAKLKGLKKGSDVLDFAGSEELAAHFFRITQTNAALKRDKVKSEKLATTTHKRVGQEVRAAIKRMGGTMPEALPAAEDRITKVTTRTAKRLKNLND